MVWLVLRFLSALLIAYWIRRGYQKLLWPRRAGLAWIIGPNLLAALTIFGATTVFKLLLVQTAAKPFILGSLVLVLVAQAIWTVFDTMLLRAQRHQERRMSRA